MLAVVDSEPTSPPPKKNLFIPSSLPSTKEMGYDGRLGEKVGTFWTKISLTGCKWSSLNAQGTETPVSHPFWGDSLFLIFPVTAATAAPLRLDYPTVVFWSEGARSILFPHAYFFLKIEHEGHGD